MSQVAEIVACRPYLMRIAMSRVNDSDRAEELVQDTLLAAIRGHTSFAGRSRFRTWITGILLFVSLAETVPLASLLPRLGLGPLLGLLALRPLLR